MASTKKYGITLEMAQEHLEIWMEAEMMLTTHQSYKLGNRELTRADLGEIRKEIEYWNDKVENLQRKGGRAWRGVPRDL